MDELAPEDKLVVARARKIQRFLSQPFHVAEVFTGSLAKYVPLKETIRGFKMIVAGECDHRPSRPSTWSVPSTKPSKRPRPCKRRMPVPAARRSWIFFQGPPSTNLLEPIMSTIHVDVVSAEERSSGEAGVCRPAGRERRAGHPARHTPLITRIRQVP